MAKRMLIDAAHPEETRVVVLSGHRLEEFDFEAATKKQIKGNIYLAKVTRVEPSLQAAFVEYGGNRHGFLAFSEIHPDYYRIPVADRQAALDADRAAEAAADEEEEEAAQHGEISPLGQEGFIREASAEIEAEAEPAEPVAHEADEPEADRPESIAEAMTLDRLVEDPGVAEASADAAAPAPAAPDEASSHAVPAGAAPEESASSFPSDDAAPEEGKLDVSAEIERPGFFLHSPEGDAFAEDDVVRSGDAEPGDENGETAHFGEAAQPSDMPVPNRSIETIGGDEIEETTRPRMRPLRHYKIQEVIKRRQIMLVQVVKEERGNKGAALTSYISLAGRYCVLMPNTPRGGGVSRKITSMQDRRRLKDLVSDLDVPDGMGVIVRTAGSERSKAEIKRDFEYLLRLWDEIRELTLKSTAPALIYEEGNLIKRSIRDLYSRDLEEVLVDGRDGYETAKSFMRMLMPSHAKRVKLYNDPTVPLFHRFQVEGQLDAIHSPVVQLRSGGYIVINPTEALVAIDVNSGRSTRERNIEETALKTNLEAAEEVARQVRLRDLAGLIVVDFIDMEEHRHNNAVERRIKEAMRHDRARIQIGHISPFGLLELSRQRLRPSLLETSTQPCPHCNGTGHIRSTESAALQVLRAIEEEGMRRRTAEIRVSVAPAVALYALNQKRVTLGQIEGRYGCHVMIDEDAALIPPAFRLDRVRAFTPAELAALPVPQPAPLPLEEEPEGDEAVDGASIEAEEDAIAEGMAALPETEGAESQPVKWLPPSPGDEEDEEEPESATAADPSQGDGQGRRRRRRRRRGRGSERGRNGEERSDEAAAPAPGLPEEAEASPAIAEESNDELAAEGDELQPAELRGDSERKRRRRGRRGGRRRHPDRGPEDRAPSIHPGLQLKLRPGEPGYSGPQEEFGEDDGEDQQPEFALDAHPEPAPEPTEHPDERTEPAPLSFSIEAESEPEPEPVAATPAVAEHRADNVAAKPAANETEAEPERAPIAYNVPPAQAVTGPTVNPRRGWWRR